MAAEALLFPGQGSHAEGMDGDWRGTPLFERGLEVLGYDPFADLGLGTRVQQPAIFLVCACALDAHGADDDVIAAAGHSLGEYAALHAAGALAFDDALRLVDERGRAMQAAAERRAGGMAAMLGGDPHAVASLARDLQLTIAHDNAPRQVVLSGDR